MNERTQRKNIQNKLGKHHSHHRHQQKAKQFVNVRPIHVVRPMHRKVFKSHNTANMKSHTFNVDELKKVDKLFFYYLICTTNSVVVFPNNFDEI